jgi:hypothetical protein
MPYNQLTSLDYFDIKAALRDYLRANSDFSDYDFEGSALGALLDVLAYNTYYTAFNANMLVNETYLDSATLRDNVVSLAKQLGYTPRSTVTSTAVVTLNVSISSNTTVPQTIILKKGTAFLAFVDNTYYQYVVLDDVQASVASNQTAVFSNLKIYEGSYLTNTYPVTSNDQFTITLNNPGIDTSTIRIRVFDSNNSTYFEKYVLSDNLLNVSPSSRVFYVNEVEDENYRIYFGDGVFGKKLTPGQVVEVSYLTTNGSLLNGASNFVYNGVITDTSGETNFVVTAESTNTVTKSFGGTEIETIDSIKLNAPAMYGAQNRAVTATDYDSIVRRVYPAVADVISYGGEEADPPEYGKVKICIKPREFNFLSSYSKRLIIDEIKKYSVASVTPEIIDPSIIFIEANSRIFYNPSSTNVSPEALKKEILLNLEKYIFESSTEKFGGKFRYSKFVSTIDSTDRAIKSNLTDITMRKDFYPSLNNKAYYEFCFSNPFDDDIDTQTLTSTGFVVQEYPNDIVYIEDRNEKIVLFKYDSQTQTKIILNPNVGSINYKDGEIKIPALTIIKGTFSDNKIEIRLKPQFNDIVAKRQIFLDVDIDKSTFTLIQE